jgi:hypothetical protein
MIHTEEDDEFSRIEHENAMKGQPYHFDARGESLIRAMEGGLDSPLYISPSQRNTVLEEVAREFDSMRIAFGDTAASFAQYVREMKQ